MLFSSVSLFILSASFYLFKKVAGSLSLFKPNMISYVFYYNLIVQTVFASLLSINYIDNHYLIGLSSDNARYYVWLSVMYLMIAMPLGMILSKWVFSPNLSVKKRFFSYVKMPINYGFYGEKRFKISLLLPTIICLFSCLYVFFEIGYFPVLKSLISSSSELQMLRINVSRDFSGNEYVKNILALLFTPLLSYVWFFYYKKNRSLRIGLLFSICFLFSASVLYYDFSKGPLLMYFLSFIFADFYSRGNINKLLIFFLVVLVVLLISFFYLKSGLELTDMLGYNKGPIGRIILSQAAGFYLVFDTFPSDFSFIGLSSLSGLLNELWGFEYVDRSARLVMEKYNQEGVDAGVAGVINSIFLAEAYANFGWFGIIFSPFWVGFCIQSLYLFFLKSNKNPLFLAVFVHFSYGGSVTGGLNDYFYNPGVLMLVVFCIILLLFASMLKRG